MPLDEEGTPHLKQQINSEGNLPRGIWISPIFKEKKGDEYVGGLAFYGKRLLKGSAVYRCCTSGFPM